MESNLDSQSSLPLQERADYKALSGGMDTLSTSEVLSLLLNDSSNNLTGLSASDCALKSVN